MSRPRRDPRAERAGRQLAGSARPRFALKLSPGEPAGRRRDPRVRRIRALVPGTARPRFDWTRDVASSAAAALLKTPAPPAAVLPEAPLVIEEPAFWILVVLDQSTGSLDETDRQLLSVARRIAGEAGGVVALGNTGSGLGEAGADRLSAWPAAAASAAAVEARTAAALGLIDTLSPRHVLCSDDPVGGGDIARRIAARRGARLAANVAAVTATAGEPVRVGRRAAGGREEWLQAAPMLMTIAGDAFAVDEHAPREARPLPPAAATAEVSRLRDAHDLPLDPETLPLGETDFIASAGNGVTDFASFTDVAAALGATRAGSRVVCDAGILPRDKQVGASGTVVTARCYLAFGIAGAPQHLQGITGVRHVVAVNTDLHAEMVKRADLSIIADAQRVMPALAELVRGGPASGGEPS